MLVVISTKATNTINNLLLAISSTSSRCSWWFVICGKGFGFLNQPRRGVEKEKASNAKLRILVNLFTLSRVLFKKNTNKEQKNRILRPAAKKSWAVASHDSCLGCCQPIVLLHETTAITRRDGHNMRGIKMKPVDHPISPPSGDLAVNPIKPLNKPYKSRYT